MTCAAARLLPTIPISAPGPVRTTPPTSVYDTAANGIGKLANENVTAGPNAGWARSYQYDSFGRAVFISTTDSKASLYNFSATYDGNSRLSTVTYPSGFKAQYSYTSLGYALQLADATTGQVYWTANARDAELRLTHQTAGPEPVEGASSPSRASTRRLGG